MNTASGRKQFLRDRAQRTVVWYLQFNDIIDSDVKQILQINVYEDVMGMFTQEALDCLTAEVNGCVFCWINGGSVTGRWVD